MPGCGGDGACAVAKPNGDPIMSPNKLTTNSKSGRAAKSIRKATGVDERKAEPAPETLVGKSGAQTAPRRVEPAGKHRKGDAPRRASKTLSHGSKQDAVVGMLQRQQGVREWRGTTHHVTVVDNSFIWNGTSYRSLSRIALAITSTKWNGPRFFSMRDGKGNVPQARHGK
jgi:hypothetical protein